MSKKAKVKCSVCGKMGEIAYSTWVSRKRWQKSFVAHPECLKKRREEIRGL
jgi:hypothetical protein